jgi:RecJ-like exonuclease
MQQYIKAAVSKFLESSKSKHTTIVSHYDTDGITSAAIMARTLSRLKRSFSLKIVKHLEPSILKELNGDLILFLDLGGTFLERFSNLNKEIIVIDHHEVPGEIPSNITVVNPRIYGQEEISAAGLTYLFCKEIDEKNKDLANLAVIGMVGDMLDKEIGKLNNDILKDADIKIKKGLLIYPATRPLHKTLEYGSGFYIPGVTGNPKGVFELLSDAGIKRENGEYKSIIDLNEEEMTHLITAVLLRKQDAVDLVGNIYLVKFFNKLEDARELSAMINACSRLEHSDIALALCLNNKTAKEKAEEIYAKYKQQLIQALKYTEENKIEGKGYVIINARNIIKDTIIGTVSSIISSSHLYTKGTIIVGLAYDNDKIKVSARVCGREGRNVREVLESATKGFPDAECGGHPMAAGCLVQKEVEQEFMTNLVKALELEVVKV